MIYNFMMFYKTAFCRIIFSRNMFFFFNITEEYQFRWSMPKYITQERQKWRNTYSLYNQKRLRVRRGNPHREKYKKSMFVFEKK
jgi:hypothetical protein